MFPFGKVARALQFAAAMSEPSIALLSDQALFREGVHALLRRHGVHHVTEYRDHRRLLADAARRSPDVVIVDLGARHLADEIDLKVERRSVGLGFLRAMDRTPPPLDLIAYYRAIA